jgi:hypothetical protein
VPVEAVRTGPFHGLVYNFQVAELEDYSVGRIGALVHNKNGGEPGANPADAPLTDQEWEAYGKAVENGYEGDPEEFAREQRAQPEAEQKDTESEVKRFSKRKLGQQEEEYDNLWKTYRKHLEKYGQEPGQTTGETNRMERQLQEYRRILEGRGRQFGPDGKLIP